MYPSVIDYVRGLSREYTGEVVYYEESPRRISENVNFPPVVVSRGLSQPGVRGLVALLKSTTDTQVNCLFPLFPNPDSNGGCGAYWLIPLTVTETGVREDE